MTTAIASHSPMRWCLTVWRLPLRGAPGFGLGCGLFCALATAAAPASGSDDTRRQLGFYASGMGQYTLADSARDSEDGLGGHIGLGAAITPWLGAEFGTDFSAFDADGASGTKFRANAFKLGGQFFVDRDAVISPYLGLGAGWVTNRRRSAPEFDATDAFVEATLGTFWSFRPSLAARLEVAWRHTNLGDIPQDAQGASNFGELMVRVGIAGFGAIPLPGGDAQAPQAAAPHGQAEAGAPDTGTTTGADTDADGVPDARDECPGSLPGIEVNAVGCGVDSDADGVADHLDECPGTPAGVQADEAGCGPVIEERYRDVNFGVDSAELTDFARNHLDETAASLARFLQTHPQARIRLVGHTDSDGNAEYNLVLGMRRAFRVRDYLVERGIPADRIEIDSVGKREPVAANDAPVNKLINRRVEIYAESR